MHLITKYFKATSLFILIFLQYFVGADFCNSICKNKVEKITSKFALSNKTKVGMVTHKEKVDGCRILKEGIKNLIEYNAVPPRRLLHLNNFSEYSEMSNLSKNY